MQNPFAKLGVILPLTVGLLFLSALSACEYVNHADTKQTTVQPANTTVQAPATAVSTSASGPRIEENSLVIQAGGTVQQRFSVPEGYERIPAEDGTFAAYLRNLPLKSHGSPVKYYDGREKGNPVYAAVIDMEIGNRDLQQCADAVMRLRAEYLYGKGLYSQIHFNFTNGFLADYTTWSKGNRIRVSGNDAAWVKQTGASNEYASFRQYMDMVFAYAGTLSLSKEMKGIPLTNMRIGDVFIKGELPGHCVIAVDMAVNKKTGKTLFMIAQSYMPAQDIHILKNTQDPAMSPWYPLDFGDELRTPEWTFQKSQLMRFSDNG